MLRTDLVAVCPVVLGLALCGACADHLLLDPRLHAVWGTKAPNCTTLEVVGSPAFIDASAWCGGDCSQVDLCLMVHDALLQLQTLFPQGGVVDARGVTTITPPMHCADDPFSGITVPSTV